MDISGKQLAECILKRLGNYECDGQISMLDYMKEREKKQNMEDREEEIIER